MIRIEHLNKYYNKGMRNEYHVINDISYEFGDNGLYVFFGPSGCGKTTLLNVIGALDKFDSGTITYFDQTLNKYKASYADEFRNKNVGYIFQNYNLIDSKSVEDNIYAILDIIGLNDSDERKKRVKICLESVGMYKYRKRNVLALSGGQRQRVAIARALAKDPKVILADEPTGNLDSNNTFEIMNIIKSISKDRLVILVSHEKDLVDYYADRIIELKDGVIVNDYLNDNSGSIKRKDVRNIYLKDYKKEEVSSDNITLDVYKDKENANAHFDVVFRNGEIYIKTSSNQKIHYIDDSSEIKLLDKSEEDFNNERLEKESNFSFESFESKDIKGKGYIGLFKGIKNAFKETKYLKRSKFSRFILIIIGIIFAFMFSSFSNAISVDKKEYILTPDNVVEVVIKHKDEIKGLTVEKLYNDLKTNSNYKSMVSSRGFSGHTLSLSIQRFYQTASTGIDYQGRIYLTKNTNMSYKIESGRDIIANDEVVLSKWVADSILDDSNAIINGFSGYSDLLDMDATINILGEKKTVKIVGVSDSKNPAVYINEESYMEENTTYLFSSEGVYISCIDKEEMIEHIKNMGYSTVSDSIKGAGFRQFKENLRAKLGTVIALLVMITAIIIYLALMIRSSLFSKIKEVGILRSIGANKKDVLSMFTGEMFVFTTLTTFISYTVTYLIILYFSLNFSVSMFKIMNPTLLTYFIGLLIIYLTTELSSIIPVSILLSKTPIEIIKKYDI